LFDGITFDSNPATPGIDPLDADNTDAIAAVMRLDTVNLGGGIDDNYTGYDLLLFFNLTTVNLGTPSLGVILNGDTTSVYSQDLLFGGAATNSLFGGSGDIQEIGALEAGAVWGTLIPVTIPMTMSH